jgi:hypothetical protein
MGLKSTLTASNTEIPGCGIRQYFVLHFYPASDEMHLPVNTRWDEVGKLNCTFPYRDYKTLCTRHLKGCTTHFGLKSILMNRNPENQIILCASISKSEVQTKEEVIPSLLPCLCPKSHHHSPRHHSQSQLQHTILSAI